MNGVDAKNIMSAFSSQFKELCDDLDRVFPDDVEVRSATTAMVTLLRANPKIVARVFHNYVGAPYGGLFEKGDLSYFLDKDYTTDIQLDNAQAILAKIDTLRGPISKMDKACHTSVLKYFSNLSKLSALLFKQECNLESA